MNFKKLLPFLAVGGIGAYFLARKVVTAKLLNVKIASVDLSKISSPAIVLRITNPTSTPISFNSILSDIMLNGNAFATLSNLKETTVNANSEIDFKLPIKLNPLEGLKLAYSLLKKPSNYTLQMVGTINSNSINFPFDITYNLK